MRPPSPSRRRIRAASAALLLLLLAAIDPARAQQPPSPPLTPPSPRVRLPQRCGAGSTDPACRARRATVAPAQAPGPATAARLDDVRGTRFVPPAIQRFLADRRLAPTTSAFLGYLASKPTESWTLNELQMVTQLVPTLTEMAIPTRTLSDFYEFLGLDPTSLFEPRLGNFNSGTGFDARNYDSVQRTQCLYLLGYGENIDPSQVLLKDLAACGNAEE